MSNRIIKQSVIRGPNGKIIGRQTNQVIDNGHTIYSETSQSVVRCSSCHRPVYEVGQWKGRCDCCGHAMCDQCISVCQACKRRVCGRCRHSFVGQRVLQVCCHCIRKLYKRQAMADEIMLSKERFRRQQQLKQHALRRQALRLQAKRQGLNARIALFRLVNAINPLRSGGRNGQRRR
ncbi:MAG: hypothetical protein JW725_05045 [Candidatus Babeliaceae bacterium]|nr:hypothetical protein [Candidatus Babeliaceae bacterium]